MGKPLPKAAVGKKPETRYGVATQGMGMHWLFTCGLILAAVYLELSRYDLFTDLLWILLGLAFSWEVCECLMEVHGTAHMQTWLAGTEHWSNRLVTDPLLFSIGALCGRWTLGKPWVSTAIWFGWYTANLMQPSCMSLQHWLMSLQ